ncbi:monovalent cation/H(+) antiporter subunit G [Diaminobutyricimonas sp. LJ205]|uniref:monovalent cation/H(+) antiporter subunit G n=1 Tax=Diaminobutyricimonas sp. LJ205 TaxID=2683590 RepID=UPI0012F52198|nr:monovalent cation/H(+) antiporter subunit G [Diaminobutyricimonas sp. LJ205]
MNLDDWIDLAAAICLLLGALLSVAASIGLLRFPDALSRMHAATKPQILGLIFVIAAIALADRHWSTVLALAPVLVFQIFTAPISAHMMGRAGYRTGNFDRNYILADDLESAVDRATRNEQRGGR